MRPFEQDLLDMAALLGSRIGQFIERKHAEEALYNAQMELAHLTRVATLGEMTASIAHEINQPLHRSLPTALPGCVGSLRKAQILKRRL
jgi:C4-dicarboxylate-specific signal transduction histidine kinase